MGSDDENMVEKTQETEISTNNEIGPKNGNMAGSSQGVRQEL